MFDGPIRGGTRGGQAEFKWSDVSADKDREHYLGHSINAPTGRWQKNKDVHWYNRDLQQSELERQEEMRRIKEVEEEALAVALGFKPAPKPGQPSESGAGPSGANAVPIERESKRIDEDVAKEERRRLKEEKRKRKEEKRLKKEMKKSKKLEGRGRSEDKMIRDRSHSRSRSRSYSRSRSRSPIPRRLREEERDRHTHNQVLRHTLRHAPHSRSPGARHGGRIAHSPEYYGRMEKGRGRLRPPVTREDDDAPMDVGVERGMREAYGERREVYGRRERDYRKERRW